MISERIIALHGFLGRPRDFDFCTNEFTSFQALDYLETPQLRPLAVGLQRWGENFFSSYSIPENISVVAYSLGGRLALSALQAQPERIDRLALLAAQFYFPEDEKPARKVWDQNWAERFLSSEDFQDLLKEWNALPIFKGSQAEPTRIESDYDRKVLAEILVKWSPAVQPDYTELLRQRQKPTLFLYGEYDQRYKNLSQRLVGSSVVIQKVPKAGHRLWCDQPDYVRDVLKEFLGPA